MQAAQAFTKYHLEVSQSPCFLKETYRSREHATRRQEIMHVDKMRLLLISTFSSEALVALADCRLFQAPATTTRRRPCISSVAFSWRFCACFCTVPNTCLFNTGLNHALCRGSAALRLHSACCFSQIIVSNKFIDPNILHFLLKGPQKGTPTSILGNPKPRNLF